MSDYLDRVLLSLRPAFSRSAAFAWFILVLGGIWARNDTYGLSSLVRALNLNPAAYLGLIHFFHSGAWQAKTLLFYWQSWVFKTELAYRVKDRIVLIGDHTNAPKDGRRIPGVTTIHQNSETASKPSYFRGHQWGCIGILAGMADNLFALPLWAEIHRDNLAERRTTAIIKTACLIAQNAKQAAYLVLDAYFSVGPVFKCIVPFKDLVHVLTRAKKNIVAFMPQATSDKPGRGRPRIYGKKLRLMYLFEERKQEFLIGQAVCYRKIETVRYLTLDLFWKPVGKILRFFLVETSRGQIVLISSDLTLDAITAISLYSRRITIETLFDMLKNILGGMTYHFWSKYLAQTSRRPIKNALVPDSANPDKTENTLAAIEKFLSVNLIALGLLQILPLFYSEQIYASAMCWLRRPCGRFASVFVTRWTLGLLIRSNFVNIKLELISRYIRAKQLNPDDIASPNFEGG